MSLESHLNEVLDYLISSHMDKSVAAAQLIQCLDLTILDESAPIESLQSLKVQAQSNQVAAICVYMKHLHHFSASSSTALATVINFPQGSEDLNQSLESIIEAKQLGANEIDYVFPYHSYFNGNKQQALDSCNAISQACKKDHLTLKIILETGAFPDMQQIYQVSKELIKVECDFLKTSTGKIAQGASLAAVFAILSAIKDSNSSCGLKVSGGVKTPQQAQNYAQLAELIVGKKISSNWFRIGASSLLNELKCSSTT